MRVALSAARQLATNLEAAGQHSRTAVKAYLALGAMFADAGEHADAADAFRQTLACQPDSVEALVGLGKACLGLGEPAEAIRHLEAAILLAPANGTAHALLGSGYHLLGEVDRGWDEFRWMWHKRPWHRGFAERLWDGSPLNGRTILLWTEQGRGDTIQFLRFVKVAAHAGGRVVVLCHHDGLISLAKRVAGVDLVIGATGPLPPFDVQAPLGYFPALFPAHRLLRADDVPYISIDAPRVARWRDRISSQRPFVIGLSYAGNEEHNNAATRFMSPTAFAPLASIPGVRLITLQYRDTSRGAQKMLSEGLMEQLHGDDFPIEDAAAIILNMDLIISVDTMIAHLAGALNKPVWTLLRYSSNWRWQFRGERTAWYPSMRLFRQKRLGEWVDVCEEVRDAVTQLVQSSDRSRS